jgi:hypothetical protein
MNLFIEIRSNAPNGPGISLDRFGLEAFKFQVFEMSLIVLLEIERG